MKLSGDEGILTLSGPGVADSWSPSTPRETFLKDNGKDPSGPRI